MQEADDVDVFLAYFDACALQPAAGARGWPHMGAVLADAALQRRSRYRAVVEPRVRALIDAWPDADTVSGLVARLARDDVGAVLRWRRPAKLAVLSKLVDAMIDLGIETVHDLRERLTDADAAPPARTRLRAIHGVGPKTVDYLAILAGSTFHVAIDVHLRRFATQAGIGPRSYGDLRIVINNAAARRGCTPGDLDAAVWAFMTDPQRQPGT